MKPVLDLIFGRRLERETDRYLDQLARAPVLASRQNASDLLVRLQAEPGPKVRLGETLWREPVTVPLKEIVRAYGLVTGGTGSGKTLFALTILKSLIDLMPHERATGFGLIDPKADLYCGAVYLLMKRLEHLARHNPGACRELRDRIVIYDFSSRDPVSSYNILARWPEAEPDFFALNRADLLLDLLPGPDKLSLGGTSVLHKLLLLLSEFGLPITHLNEVLHNEQLRNRLVARTSNDTAQRYFNRQFASEPKPTIEAIARRMEALFASEGVRLSLSGNTAPDFRLFQDEGKIVLVNCFGETISRSVRRLLQGLVLSDIRQSVFARRKKERAFFWCLDEAQNFFVTEKLRENMSDLLSMSRTFGSHFLYLTQNMGTAVQDPRIMKILTTNIRWSFSMRGEPGDCEFLKSALPVTGRKARPQANPFAEESYYSLAEERAMALDEIARLPDRVGYLWLKARSAEVLKIRTQELVIPQGPELERATLRLSRDATFGQRVSRKDYERLVAERDQAWAAEPEGDFGATLAEAYERVRGDGSRKDH